MCVCVYHPVTCRTINGAELPLVSAGEDFFIQSFSLLELALLQVTGCLRNTNIKSQHHTVNNKEVILHVTLSGDTFINKYKVL